MNSRHVHSLRERPPTHQGVVKDLPEVGVQVVYVIPGSGQEPAKFMLIAEVEEDALEWRSEEKGEGDPWWLLPYQHWAPGPIPQALSCSPCPAGFYRRPCQGQCHCWRIPPSGATLSSGSPHGSHMPGICRAHSTRPWRHHTTVS